jgi:preprotein translocase subunit SecE
MVKGKPKKRKRNTAARTVVQSSSQKDQASVDTQSKSNSVSATKMGKVKSILKMDKDNADVKTDKGKEAAKTSKKSPEKKPGAFRRLVQYFNDVKSELKRVTWPTKQEVLNSSLVVIGALIFFGVLIFLVDAAVVPLLTAYSGLGQ